MSRYVLDASAVMALLNSETGARRVEEILSDSVKDSPLTTVCNHEGNFRCRVFRKLEQA